MSRTSTFSLLKVPIDSHIPHVQIGASKEMQQGNTVINFLCFLIPIIIIMHNNTAELPLNGHPLSGHFYKAMAATT